MQKPDAAMAAEIEICRRSLSEFIKRAWHVIEPTTEYKHNWHIDLIAEHLSQIPDKTTRLCINIPPRYMKSIAVTIMWPLWLWTIDPSLRFMFCSYSAPLALKHSVDRRTIIRSQWFQDRWGHIVKLKGDQDTKQEYQNTAGGSMMSTSVGGAATGMGGDIIVVDDPMNPAIAMSDAERTTANDWLDTTLTTRLNDKTKGAIVLVMQRLHTDDATASMMKAGGWEHIKLDCPATEDSEIRFPVSGKVKSVKIGDPVWPERETSEQLARQQVIMGTWAFAGQYLQRPSPLGGGIIKRKWFQFYDRDALDMSSIPRIICSWDPTFKKEGSSKVGGQAWAVRGPDRFLLDCVFRDMGFLETMRAMDAMRLRYERVTCTLVEAKANGDAIMEVFGAKVPGVVAFEPHGSKEERLQAVSPQVESGNIYLPSGVPWLEEFLEEVCNFPATKHSDHVDPMTQALLYIGDGRMQIDITESNLSGQRQAANLSW